MESSAIATASSSVRASLLARAVTVILRASPRAASPCQYPVGYSAALDPALGRAHLVTVPGRRPPLFPLAVVAASLGCGLAVGGASAHVATGGSSLIAFMRVPPAVDSSQHPCV